MWIDKLGSMICILHIFAWSSDEIYMHFGLTPSAALQDDHFWFPNKESSFISLEQMESVALCINQYTICSHNSFEMLVRRTMASKDHNDAAA